MIEFNQKKFGRAQCAAIHLYEQAQAVLVKTEADLHAVESALEDIITEQKIHRSVEPKEPTAHHRPEYPVHIEGEDTDRLLTEGEWEAVRPDKAAVMEVLRQATQQFRAEWRAWKDKDNDLQKWKKNLRRATEVLKEEVKQLILDVGRAKRYVEGDGIPMPKEEESKSQQKASVTPEQLVAAAKHQKKVDAEKASEEYRRKKKKEEEERSEYINSVKHTLERAIIKVAKIQREIELSRIRKDTKHVRQLPKRLEEAEQAYYGAMETFTNLRVNEVVSTNEEWQKLLSWKKDVLSKYGFKP